MAVGNLFHYHLQLLLILSQVSVVSSDFPVRLRGSTEKMQGRIEVFHDGEWGTVCDDGLTNNVCVVVCKQLGLKGGLCVSESVIDGCLLNNGSVMNSSNSSNMRVWIDEIMCEGIEQSLAECRRNHWGDVDCFHKEDAGCICQPLPTANDGICDRSRHRIVPFSKASANMGRVEIQADDGTWGLVCDDEWDDVDATVFCNCLGYKEPQYFRAMLHPRHEAKLEMLYDGINCQQDDTLITKNLWECQTKLSTDGRCNPNVEAAAVMCGPPQVQLVSPAIPDVSMTCNGRLMRGCFKTASRKLVLPHFHLQPNCSTSAAKLKLQPNGDVCFEIDMSACPGVSAETDNSKTKQYCHDVTYSKSGLSHDRLLTSSFWTRRMCCVTETNGTVVASFHLQKMAQPVFSKYNRHPNNYSIACYRSESRQSDVMSFPATVQHGEPVTCYVDVATWDPRLYLVVPNCQFHWSMTAGTRYQFVKDRCPTSDDLGLHFYSISYHSWGFKFNAPKFVESDYLYLTCSVYLCDPSTDPKSFCDRSCGVKSSGDEEELDVPPSRRRKRSAKLNNKEKYIQDNSGSDAFERFDSGSDADESLESSNDAYEDINLADKVESYLEGGPFFIKTALAGPLINSDGNLVMADADLGMTRIERIHSKNSKSSASIFTFSALIIAYSLAASILTRRFLRRISQRGAKISI